MSIVAKEGENINYFHCNAKISDSFADDRILVVLNEGVDKYQFISENKQIISGKLKFVNHLNSNLLKTGEGVAREILSFELVKKGKENVLALINELEKDKNVYCVEPDYLMELSNVPNDPEYVNHQTNYMNLIRMPQAWNLETGSNSVIVGILDTGITAGHPDLTNRVNRQLSRDFHNGIVEMVTIPVDEDLATSHGTHVAGIIGAQGNNSIGVSGICWNITLVSLRITSFKSFYSSRVILAIDYASEVGMPILNLSGSLTPDSELYNFSMQQAIEQFDGLFICSAGNSGLDIDSNNERYPACYPSKNIITVGNSTNYDTKSINSSYGNKSVDLFAPGENIYSTMRTGNQINLSGCTYGTLSGTSMSAPLVTGVAALLLSKYPNLSPTEIKASILMNVDIIPALSGYCLTGGRLNAYKALTNPHTHSNSYSFSTNIKHKVSCSCGIINSYTENHVYGNDNTCIYCNYVHNHFFRMKYYNRYYHTLTCDCSATSGDYFVHSINRSDSNKAYANCLGCGKLLDLSYDIAMISN